jgi:transposase InsO family protein
LIITAVVLEHRSQAEVARSYNVSKGWVSKLIARWRAEGDAAFLPRSRRPRTSPNAVPASTVGLIVNLRTNLQVQGLDHGPATIAWHLHHHHAITVSAATVSRHLTRQGLVTPEPKKRPKSTYIRFEADLPNECWQSDFTHWHLADGTGVEILTFLDDCTRYAISVTPHTTVTTQLLINAFRTAIAEHGVPASTLTDNGMIYTVRLAGRRRAGGRNAFEHELRRLNITQKNGAPAHPQTQGKVERFQQTMKKWLTAQPPAADLPQLGHQLDDFVDYYNHHRPHRSLPRHGTPASRYQTLPKATPEGTRDHDTHHRVRHDKIAKNGIVTLRNAGRLHHIPIGRAHAGTRILLLAQDLNIRIVNAATGELLRELQLDPTRDYQPLNNRKPPNM